MLSMFSKFCIIFGSTESTVQVRKGQASSDKVITGKERSGQFRSGQVKSGQVRSGQVM